MIFLERNIGIIIYGLLRILIKQGFEYCVFQTQKRFQLIESGKNYLILPPSSRKISMISCDLLMSSCFTRAILWPAGQSTIFLTVFVLIGIHVDTSCLLTSRYKIKILKIAIDSAYSPNVQLIQNSCNDFWKHLLKIFYSHPSLLLSTGPNRPNLQGGNLIGRKACKSQAPQCHQGWHGAQLIHCEVDPPHPTMNVQTNLYFPCPKFASIEVKLRKSLFLIVFL